MPTETQSQLRPYMYGHRVTEGLEDMGTHTHPPHTNKGGNINKTYQGTQIHTPLHTIRGARDIQRKVGTPPTARYVHKEIAYTCTSNK